MQNEHIELPINIQETPEYLLDKAEPYAPSKDPNEAASELLKNLESLIKSPQQDLHLFYETAFPATQKAHFAGEKAAWPSPPVLEQLFNLEYKPGAQTIYQEYTLRQGWSAIKAASDEEYMDYIDLVWETYTSLFELEWTRVNFSPGMIWDYFDSFLRVSAYHQSRGPALSSRDGFSSSWFNREETKAILKKMSDQLPTTLSANPTTKEVFSYYSLAALAVVMAQEQNYVQAIQTIKKISLKEIAVFSKACGSLLSLFLNTAISHFLLEEFNKSAKLLETIVPFYQKNKKYFSKSAQSAEGLHRLHEKAVGLLCINYIFLEEKPKASIMETFKNLTLRSKDSREKISDCFLKMKQHDSATFSRLFSLVIADYHITEIVEVTSQKFRNLRSITLNTIIQNYSRIQLSKMASMLNISQQHLFHLLMNFDAVEQSQSPWDLTIMSPLLRQKKKINVEIQGDVAVFDSQNADSADSSREWQRYREEFAWLAEKVKSI